MKTEIRHPDKQVSTGAYSAGIEVDGWLFVSGQGPLDLKTGKVVAGTIEEETRLTMQHIGRILQAAGGTFADVVRCGCHLADINDFDGFNRAYSEFFDGAFPARTTVQSGLGGGIKVEIDCMARLPRKRKKPARPVRSQGGNTEPGIP
jgi:2-iminobutanoate/2-iminopropanoate deaminase